MFWKVFWGCHGFQSPLLSDRSFIFHLHIDAGCILVVYVDEVVIIGVDYEGIIRLKQFLKQHFHTKDLCKLWYFLGIEIVRSKLGINLSQRKYVLDMLD